MPNAKVDEGEIALIIGEGGLKPATLARRKRIRAHFQAFTVENYEKDLTELINGPKEASARQNVSLTTNRSPFIIVLDKCIIGGTAFLVVDKMPL